MENIRKQIRFSDNARFLRSLPTFRVEEELPDNFSALLGRLDDAERSQVNGTKHRRCDN